MECGNMGVFDRGVQMLLTTVGAFAAFSLMTIAVGTDYWLYSRGVCKIKSTNENETSKKNEEVMTHSGLWRTCCLEGEWLHTITLYADDTRCCPGTNEILFSQARSLLLQVFGVKSSFTKWTEPSKGVA